MKIIFRSGFPLVINVPKVQVWGKHYIFENGREVCERFTVIFHIGKFHKELGVR